MRDITEYMRHLPTCNLEQNWDEALIAMADTPTRFRDADYYEALNELSRKMNTCTCGLIEAKAKLSDLTAANEQIETMGREIERLNKESINSVR